MDSAEAWQARLHSSECTPADRASYQRWQREHPEAAESCRQAERIYALSGALARDPWLKAAARAAHRQSARERRHRVPRFAWAVAAAVMLLITGGVGWHGLFAPAPDVQQFASAVGQLRMLHLEDGTSVLLDTDSAVTVRYDTGQREVDLDRGRAQFEVAHDAGWPFVVHAGGGVIRDVGTRFQVRRRTDDITVTLLSGVVNVSLPAARASTDLMPGQQLSYSAGRLGSVHTIDLAAARGWTHGEMVFQDRTLADLVAEMNRYSTEQLQLGNPALAKLRISGVFHAGDQASLVQALRQGWGLRAHHASSQVVVLEPPVAR